MSLQRPFLVSHHFLTWDDEHRKITIVSDQRDSNPDSSGPSFIKAPALSKSKNQSLNEASKFTYRTQKRETWKA